MTTPLYITLPAYSDDPGDTSSVVRTEEVVPGNVFVDYDAHGHPVGVEVLDWGEVRSDAFRQVCESAQKAAEAVT